jgi:hypothetical protein
MSHLSNTLQRAMDERRWKQIDVVQASRGELSQSQVSRYLSGTIPDRESIVVLTTCFIGDMELDLMRAWLRDQTPEQYRSEIEILPIAHRGAKSHEEDALARRIEALPNRARSTVERLVTAIEKRPDVATAVETMLALLKPAD